MKKLWHKIGCLYMWLRFCTKDTDTEKKQGFICQICGTKYSWKEKIIKTYRIIIDLREKDVDGNKIDTKKLIEEIRGHIIKRFWNVAGIK